MKKTRFSTAATAAFLILGCFMFLALQPALHAQSEASESPDSLQGTWWVTVTQYDCATGAARPSFTSLLAFARGGTMSETTGNPAFQPGQRTSGYGTWSSTEDDTYTSTDESFIVFSAGPFMQGTQRINHSIRVDGNQLSDKATVQFFDTEGRLLVSGCARATGTRLQ
ncbi:MAG TPA: hypothetical protein VGS02_09540 [Acidobacteriaceae bacterium]|nr:hypothetical protein [Acidobacteriaceae bacterium]